jgi:hypothetical protein
VAQGRRGEIKTCHPGAQARQGKRVGADVALQMDAAPAANVAEERLVEAHRLAQEGGVVRNWPKA